MKKRELQYELYHTQVLRIDWEEIAQKDRYAVRNKMAILSHTHVMIVDAKYVRKDVQRILFNMQQKKAQARHLLRG